MLSLELNLQNHNKNVKFTFLKCSWGGLYFTSNKKVSMSNLGRIVGSWKL